MLQVNTPGEDDDLFFGKTEIHCDFCRTISVSDQGAGMLKGKTGTVLIQFADMDVLHQVKTPAHRQKVGESCFRCQNASRAKDLRELDLAELSDNAFSSR